VSNPIESARNYLAKMDPAVSGQGGHGQTFHVACVLINGFGFTKDEARPLLNEYNARCLPPWGEREIEHKLAEAEKEPDPKGRGYLRKAKGKTFYATSPTPSVSPPNKPMVVRPGQYHIDAKAELPKPIADGCRELLRACFREGEGIRIVPASLGDDQRELPEGEGHTLTREEWLERLDKKGGDPNGIFSSAEKTGIYIAVNPLKVGCTKDADVTDFRHALLEFDDIPIPDQWDLIKKSNVPCAALIHSGGRSIHAWVRIGASDKAQYDERVKTLFDHFAEYGIDFKNKNPSRLSRLPFCVRFDKRQELLALRCGAETFDEWNSVAGEGLPPLESLEEGINGLNSGGIKLPDEVITGLLHCGHRMALGGGSKTFKTWCLMDLAISVGAGTDWFGFHTKRGKVLYLNFEIDRAHCFKRFNSIASARNLELDLELVTVWNLRDHIMPHGELIPKVIAASKHKEFSLIILDPLYKIMGVADENKASDISALLNGMGSISKHTGASVVFANHFSKGNQAGKESIDRISGSGVFARDPDTILVLTRHEEENAFSVDVTLRNFEQVKPFATRWKYPLMTRDNVLDPKKLKQPPKPEPKYVVSQVLLALGSEWKTYTDWKEAAINQTGMGESTFDRLRKQAEKMRSIEEFSEGKNKKYRLSKSQPPTGE
jgi:RecA-family ATPase